MPDHKLGGVASLVGGGKLPASITMDPAGIDLFAAILHVTYAAHHAKSDKDIHAYLERFLKPDITVSWDSGGVYHILHRDRGVPVVIHVNTEEPIEDSVAVQTPSGVFADVSLKQIQIVPPTS